MTIINKSLAASGETLIYNNECELAWPFPVYNVYTYGNHGTVSANPNAGIEGTEVTLSNTPEVFYQFNGYTINGATLKNTNQFDINNSNVYVTGNFVSTLPEGVVCLYAHPDEVPPQNKTGDYYTPSIDFEVKTTGYNYYLVTYKEKFAKSAISDIPLGGFTVHSWNTHYGFHIYYNAKTEEPISQYSGMHCVEDNIWGSGYFDDAIDSIRSGRHGDGNYSYYYDNPAKPASSFITHSVLNDAPLQPAQADPGWYSANWSVYEDTTFVGRTIRAIQSGFHGASIYGNAYDNNNGPLKNYCPITARDFYIFACNTRQPLVNLLSQLS